MITEPSPRRSASNGSVVIDVAGTGTGTQKLLTVISTVPPNALSMK